jgi:cobalt-zinc-cadmium efflux system outer membrane protein
MEWTPLNGRRAAFVLAAVVACVGCATKNRHASSVSPSPLSQNSIAPSPPGEAPRAAANADSAVRLASHRRQERASEQLPPPASLAPEAIVAPQPQPHETLPDLEAFALASNPTLRRMQHEAGAAWSKTGYVSKLPDPTASTMFFVPPMNFEPDRQVGELQVMQMIPWLDRLKAAAQRAHLEALAAETLYQAERLRIIGDIRTAWFKLYVLGKQIETTEADQAQLESLITTANARIRTGDAQPGDVLMATLELSSLQEQLLGYRQQVAATKSELNRLAGRDAGFPVVPPTEIDVRFPQWSHELLRQVALQSQPELNAARLRTAATRWGIEVARLQRRPDLTFGVGWVVMDAPGATMPDAGRDSLTLSVSGNIPIWRHKYDAMFSEATREHYAAHASEDEIALRLDALLLDLWEQARASQKTIELYEASILPQARQTFEANQKSLINNAVTFDRVIRDYRTLLNLELGYHRALGQLATTLARIRQAAGVDLLASPELPPQS